MTIKTELYPVDNLTIVIENFHPQLISGWALYLHKNDPVVLELIINGEMTGEIKANKLREDLVNIRQDCAFSFQATPFLNGDWHSYIPKKAIAELRLKDTQQTVAKTLWDGLAPEGQSGIRANGGACMRLNKGIYVVPLSEQTESFKRHLVATAASLIQTSHESGYLLAVAYGTLLGLVREGDLLGHDDDLDLMFISNATTMLEAIGDFHNYQIFLQSKGYAVRELTNGQIHASRDEIISIDVFLSWFEHDDFNLTFTIRGGIPRNHILPLAKLQYLDQTLPIPNNPYALLNGIYGPTWRTPDPSFQWQRPKSIEAFFSPIHNYNRSGNREYWESYYRRLQPNQFNPPDFPSQFSIFALAFITTSCVLVDLGCGNGRDSIFFARNKIKTIGLDYSQEAIEQCIGAAKPYNAFIDLEFMCFDVSNLAQQARLVQKIDHVREGKPLCIYSRFFFHAVDENSEDAALLLISELLTSPNDCAILEFRTNQDALRTKATGEHFRRYINVDAFIEKCKIYYKLNCSYRVEGIGYAIYRNDDAHVARLILNRIFD